jgi:mono/diheme cytochrome c family protein
VGTLLRATAVLSASVLAACNSAQSGKTDVAGNQEAIAAQAKAEQSIVDRGKYLVAVAACSDCHTPMKEGPNGPEPDMTRYLAGHPQDLKLPPVPTLSSAWSWSSATNTAFGGPWGVSYSTNLTPDRETGLGAWSEQVFVNALKTGRHMGVGRPILPPMPWSAYAQMTDEDLRAVFAYLRTIDARKNQVPEPIVSTPPAPLPSDEKAPAVLPKPKGG